MRRRTLSGEGLEPDRARPRFCSFPVMSNPRDDVTETDEAFHNGTASVHFHLTTEPWGLDSGPSAELTLMGGNNRFFRGEGNARRTSLL